MRPLAVPLALVLANALASAPAEAGGAGPARGLVAHWRCEPGARDTVPDTSGNNRHGAIQGDATFARGATGKALRLDGVDDHVVVKDAPSLSFPDATFSVAAWINVYALGAGQQMIVGKNVYALNRREWGLMVDRDNRLRLYLHRGRWRTVGSKSVPTPGAWLHVAATVQKGKARLYVNGVREGEAALGTPIADTTAPLTLGGIDNHGALMQLFFGAIDEVCVYNRALSDEEVQGMSFDVTDTHELPPSPFERFRLWEGATVPAAAEIPLLEGVRFVVVKTREPEIDGYDWLHGAAIVRHKGTLFACWGHNKGKENTVTEVNRGRRSADDGRTWSPVETIGPGIGAEGRKTEAHSHGVFLAHEGALWAFLARFGKGEGRFRGLCMEAFTLDETADRWVSRGIVGRGCWPLREPERMADGNWLIPGCDEHWRASVAISRGDDLTTWDSVKIPVRGRVHTEATCWIDGPEITLVMRNHSPRDRGRNCAAVSVSRDYGRTWSPSVDSNLPMTTSKPYAGTLSTGQRYLLGTVCRGHGGKRWPLTIAVGRPGQKTLCRIWRIRDARRPGAGDAVDKALAYPHAIEHDGKLYVIYSAGLRGNRNDCELAILPVEALAVH